MCKSKSKDESLKGVKVKTELDDDLDVNMGDEEDEEDDEEEEDEDEEGEGENSSFDLASKKVMFGSVKIYSGSILHSFPYLLSPYGAQGFRPGLSVTLYELLKIHFLPRLVNLLNFIVNCPVPCSFLPSNLPFSVEFPVRGLFHF